MRNLKRKARVAALYDRVAVSYDQVGPDVFARFGQLMVTVAKVTEGMQVLDVATGRGANRFPAAAPVGPTGHVEAIDLSQQMVRETAAAIEACGVTNARVLPLDAEDLQFADASFDRVLCSFAYFFFARLDRALAEFHRVLRPDGMLALTAHGPADERWSWYEELLSAFYAAHGLALLPFSGRRYEVDDLKGLLRDAGFVEVRPVPLEVEAVYADEQQCWAAKWTHGARRPLEQMSPKLLARFRSEVSGQLASLLQADGYHERWRIICLLAARQ